MKTLNSQSSLSSYSHGLYPQLKGLLSLDVGVGTWKLLNFYHIPAAISQIEQSDRFLVIYLTTVLYIRRTKSGCEGSIGATIKVTAFVRSLRIDRFVSSEECCWGVL